MCTCSRVLGLSRWLVGFSSFFVGGFSFISFRRVFVSRVFFLDIDECFLRDGLCFYGYCVNVIGVF